MAIVYTPEQREQMATAAKGKVIESLEWIEDNQFGDYWSMTFTDGSETALRFMAELI